MHKKDVAISMPLLASITVLLPLSAFIFCLICSLIFNFEKATFTHCESRQFAPSISAVTGGPPPFKHVWMVSIALQFWPRILFARLYFSYFKGAYHIWAQFLFGLPSLCFSGLSFVTSSDVFIIHEVFFITFMITSMMSMMLTMFHLYRSCGYQVRTRYERTAIQCKTVLAKSIIISACLALYFYWRHNEYCEDFVYSFFAISEYSIVLCNMVYHWLASYDFYHCMVTIRVSGRMSSISMLINDDRDRNC